MKQGQWISGKGQKSKFRSLEQGDVCRLTGLAGRRGWGRAAVSDADSSEPPLHPALLGLGSLLRALSPLPQGLNIRVHLLADVCIISRARSRKWQPTPVFLPGESRGQGSLAGCRLWGRTESDTTDVT